MISATAETIVPISPIVKATSTGCMFDNLLINCAALLGGFALLELRDVLAPFFVEFRILAGHFLTPSVREPILPISTGRAYYELDALTRHEKLLSTAIGASVGITISLS